MIESGKVKYPIYDAINYNKLFEKYLSYTLALYVNSEPKSWKMFWMAWRYDKGNPITWKTIKDITLRLLLIYLTTKKPIGW